MWDNNVGITIPLMKEQNDIFALLQSFFHKLSLFAKSRLKLKIKAYLSLI